MNFTVPIASLSVIVAGATLGGNVALKEPVAAPLQSEQLCQIEVCRADDAGCLPCLRALKSKLEEMEHADAHQLARCE